jgi:hypothetical protein
MKDLKNLLPDEETAKELYCYSYPEIGHLRTITEYVEALKQSGIIRKSVLEEAREKTDEYVNDLGKGFGNFNSLEQLIQAERQAVDKKE